MPKARTRNSRDLSAKADAVGGKEKLMGKVAKSENGAAGRPSTAASKSMPSKSLNGASSGSKERRAPFHLKKALKKKLALVERYKELRDKGTLEDFMAKRRKKMMRRDHTLIPRARNAR